MDDLLWMVVVVVLLLGGLTVNGDGDDEDGM